MAAARRRLRRSRQIPIAAPDRDGTQLALGGFVGHAEAASIEEAGERDPALEAVVDRLADITVLGDSLALLGVRPLISRSMANRTSKLLTASAAIGALLMRAKSKNLRLACLANQNDAARMSP
jgi:hypothetical protein